MNVLKRIATALVVLTLLQPTTNAELISPEKYFGFTPGADGELFTYESLIEYLKILDAESPNVEIREIGLSPEGRKMFVVFISSEDNINSLDALREMNEQLAMNPDLSDAEKEKILAEGKVFALATLSMHSSEVGPSQAAPLIAYELATSEDQEMTSWLNDVVFMMVPCHNPDGMNMVVNHYHKHKGTKYEGSRMPGIYHKYVGHDNNRDFVSLTQSDNRAISDLYTKTWFPQVMVEKHQMWSHGARYFVPPMHDPIAVNINEEVWNWTWVFGTGMAKEMTREGLAGVTQHYLFDDYWPGATETALWKSTIGLLTEAASAHYAKPVFIEPTEITMIGKGLSSNKKSINMPLPWEGGWWRLSDIVEYERVSTYGFIKTASLHRKEVLQFRNDMCVKEVAKGKSEAPYYYILPKDQKDGYELNQLVLLMKEHNVQTYTLDEETIIDQKVYKKGDLVVPLSQPYRAFIKEVFEKQEFPTRYYNPGGKLIKPYDITSWSLPLHRGLKADEINTNVTLPLSAIENDLPVEIKEISSEGIALSPTSNGSYLLVFKLLNQGKEIYRTTNVLKHDETIIPPGAFIIQTEDMTAEDLQTTRSEFTSLNNLDIPGKEKLTKPRIGLIETIFHDMDAGWTRWVLDQYDIKYTVLSPAQLKEAELSDQYDVLVFPDADHGLILNGKASSPEGSYWTSGYAHEYIKSLEKDGLQKLMKWIDDGGKVVSWGKSTKLFMGDQTIVIDEKKETKEEFALPVKDISGELKKQELYCPGTFVKVDLLGNHPLTYGLGSSLGVFSRANPVFKTSVPYLDMDRRVIGTYPEKDIVLSGYAENIEKLGNKPSIVWLKKGKGQIVMMGFSPQFRGSTPGTYKLLFNSLLM